MRSYVYSRDVCRSGAYTSRSDLDRYLPQDNSPPGGRFAATRRIAVSALPGRRQLKRVVQVSGLIRSRENGRSWIEHGSRYLYPTRQDSSHSRGDNDQNREARHELQ